MNIKVERGIPMPAKNKSITKYPWDDLKVGDSFKVAPRTNGRQLCIQASMTRAPKQFESRVVAGECRIWRTK
jgi:hypothetical protein